MIRQGRANRRTGLPYDRYLKAWQAATGPNAIYQEYSMFSNYEGDAWPFLAIQSCNDQVVGRDDLALLLMNTDSTKWTPEERGDHHGQAVRAPGSLKYEIQGVGGQDDRRLALRLFDLDRCWRGHAVGIQKHGLREARVGDRDRGVEVLHLERCLARGKDAETVALLAVDPRPRGHGGPARRPAERARLDEDLARLANGFAVHRHHHEAGVTIAARQVHVGQLLATGIAQEACHRLSLRSVHAENPPAVVGLDLAGDAADDPVIAVDVFRQIGHRAPGRVAAVDHSDGPTR